jgi:hypothetical protein
VVRYIDLPVFGVPMHLAWKKHRLRCPTPGCPKRTFSLSNHRIAAELLRLRIVGEIPGVTPAATVRALPACDFSGCVVILQVESSE